MNMDAAEGEGSQRLRSLLSPFTDAGTELGLRRCASGDIGVSGVRDFKPFEMQMRFVAGKHWPFEVRMRRRRQHLVPLVQTLASGRFASLDKLARSMLNNLTRRLGDPSAVVESMLTPQEDSQAGVLVGGGMAVAAQLALERRLSEAGGGGTRLTFVHGSAGTGKSWLLMLLALRRAQAFLSRKADTLYLYVDAQGANLRTLEQTLAHQLDVYNGSLRFGEVVPLLRIGGISLIVDGFDELITPSGFNDTLNALCAYLDSLEGDGAVLASARSAFFHANDLWKAGVQPQFPVEQEVLEVAPWGKPERTEFCSKRGMEEVADQLEALAEDVNTGELLARPFIVSKAADLLKGGGRLEPGSVMLGLEHAFVQRELGEKLLTPDGTPVITEDQLSELLAEIAVDMWHMRATSITVDSLRTLVEMYTEQWDLRAERREILESRMDSNPFLELAPGPGALRRIQFPHEILFSRFLARALIRYAKSGQRRELRHALGRSPLSESCRRQFSEIALIDESREQMGRPVVRKPVAAMIEALVEGAGERPGRHAMRGNILLNLGALVHDLLRRRKGKQPVRVSSMPFQDFAAPGAVLEGVEFRECRFEEIDARASDWSGVSFVDCDPIDKLIVEANQRIPQSLPPTNWLVVAHEGGEMTSAYGPYAVRESLFGICADGSEVASTPIVLSEDARQVSDLARRLARRAARVFWISEQSDDTDDQGMRRIKHDANWPRLLDLLGQSSLIERRLISMRGRSRAMFHLLHAESILVGQDPSAVGVHRNVRTFWGAVHSL